MLSSTNCWCVMTGDSWREIPLICWVWREFFTRRPSPSTINTKRKGERGSPWRMPLEGWKGREGMPFTKMKKKVEETRFITHLTDGGEKPKLVSILCMYIQLNLSKAFERSILRSIPAFLLCFKEWMISCVRMMSSMICLPSMYPDCSGDISKGSSGFS